MSFRIFFVIRSTARLSFLCAWVVRRAILDFVNVYRIFSELKENSFESVFKPSCLSLKRDAFLELLVVPYSIYYFVSGFSSFYVY